MSKSIIIRQEEERDHPIVFKLIKAAFAKMDMSDHKEHHMVERLRKSTAFVPELSMVAVSGDEIVGHIILSRIQIINDHDIHESLALAPVSVLPEYQNQGIGGKLINAVHTKAKALGFGSIVLLGHDQYYPRFGYMQADTYGIILPFDVPKEYCMAIELDAGSLDHVFGTVQYPKEFYE